MNKYATIILCGGASKRMGTPKLNLPFGNETLLNRTIRIVQQVTPKVILAAGQNQQLPNLSEKTNSGEVEIVRDQSELPGPLGGLFSAASSIALQTNLKAIFICTCDTPLISKPVLNFLKEKYESAPNKNSLIVAATEPNRTHPFPGLYDISLFQKEGKINTLWKAGNRRMIDLLEQSNLLKIPAENFRTADPNLNFLLNINTPKQYQTALKRLKP